MAMSFLGLEGGNVCEGPWVDDELDDTGTMALMTDSLVPFPDQDAIGDSGVKDTAIA